MKEKLRIFFDTETTGLPMNYSGAIEDKENWPFLVQVAWVIYCGEEEISCNNYIVKPMGYEIPEGSAKIHRITNEIALEKGHDINFVLKKFMFDMQTQDNPRVDEIIAHNLSFDRNIIKANVYRYYEKLISFMPLNVCTMKSTTNLCRIHNGRGGYKWPKLEELYRFLFNEDFEDAHDALVDVRAMVKCYFELERRGFDFQTGKMRG